MRHDATAANNTTEEIRFSELVKVNPTIVRGDLKPEDPVSFIPMSDITDSGQWLNRQTRPLKEVTNGYTSFEEGDILFAKITPCTENCKGYHVRGLVNGLGFGSTEFHVLRARPGINCRMIYHLSVARDVRQKAAGMMGGSAGQQRVPSDFFRHFKLSSRWLDRQDELAALLDSVSITIETTEELIQQARQVKSAFLDQFILKGLSGKRTKFTKHHLGELFDERKERGKPGLPTFSVTMANGLVDRESMDRRVVSDLSPHEHLLVRKGDIAYNMMRMWQGVYGLAHHDGIVSPAYVVVKPKAAINSHYASYLFRHRKTIRKFERFSQGLTEDRLRLYYDEFAAIPVEIPDLDTQHTIATTLQAVDHRIDAEEKKLGALIDLKAALSQGLLTGLIPVAGQPASQKRHQRKERP